MEADAILFDFDGVILDTEWSIYESMRGVFVENGHDLPLEEYVKCIGSDFNTWSPETMLEGLTGKTFDWQTIGIARNKWIREEIAKLDAMPGVRDAVAFCQKREAGSSRIIRSHHRTRRRPSHQTRTRPLRRSGQAHRTARSKMPRHRGLSQRNEVCPRSWLPRRSHPKPDHAMH
jgi:beta-phosphoglucomutase-like phosphatase (HAD superfamily)